MKTEFHLISHCTLVTDCQRQYRADRGENTRSIIEYQLATILPPPGNAGIKFHTEGHLLIYPHVVSERAEHLDRIYIAIRAAMEQFGK